MSALATTLASTIGDITSSLDKQDLYDPLNELKFKTEQVYVKLIRLIEKFYHELFLPGTASGFAPTTTDQIDSINEALAILAKTGTPRFLELKMIIQMYADLLHEIAEGTLSSSDETINTLLRYAKKLAGLFDDMFTHGINGIKQIKGFAPGSYRYLEKYLFGNMAENPAALLDLTELDDSVVPLVIFNVLNKIRDDSILWDTGELTLEEQQAYLLTGMKAMEFKRRMESGDEGGAKFLAMLKYIFDKTNFIDKKTADLTKEALKGDDVKSLLTTAENIISEKRYELKSLDDIERDDGAASTIYAADHIQADYYKPKKFFRDILKQIFNSVLKDVPEELNFIADKLDEKIVKSVPDAKAFLPMEINRIVGAHGAATPTIEMESTHPYRGVSLQAVKARSFLEHELKKEIFKHIIQTSPVITAPKISNLIIGTGDKIKVKRAEAKLFYNTTIKAVGEHDMDDKTLDILIGQMRSDAIKSIKVIKTFESKLMLQYENLKKMEKNVDDINMEVLEHVFEIIERYYHERDVSQFEARGEEVEKVKQLMTGLYTKARENTVKAALKRIKGSCTKYLKKLQEHKDREKLRQQARREAVAGRVGGGKRNTKKQKKNQKKKTMKAPHKRTIKKRKRRKNKTSKNRS